MTHPSPFGKGWGSPQPCQLLGLPGFFSPVVRGERHPRETWEVPAHVTFQEILINERKAGEFHSFPGWLVTSLALPKCPADPTRTGHTAVPTPSDTPAHSLALALAQPGDTGIKCVKSNKLWASNYETLLVPQAGSAPGPRWWQGDSVWPFSVPSAAFAPRHRQTPHPVPPTPARAPGCWASCWAFSFPLGASSAVPSLLHSLWNCYLRHPHWAQLSLGVTQYCVIDQLCLGLQ